MFSMKKALLPLFIAGTTSQDPAPACVLTPSGTMLCCAADDYECLSKLQKAHPEPEKSLSTTFNQQSFVPPTAGLVGSMYTFGGAPVWDGSKEFDVAVVGVPFGLRDDDTQAPGMQLVRKEASASPPYSRLYGSSLKDYDIVDGQDLAVDGETMQRFRSLEAGVEPFYKTGKPVVALGADHTITVPLMRAASKATGKFAVLHIDKDLAIGNGDSREQPLHDSTAMFWAVAAKLFDPRHSLHIGARGNLPSQKVELLDQELGFQTITAEDFTGNGIPGVVQMVKERLARRDGSFMPAYISLDVDVLDLPGGEPGGLSLNELRALLAGLRPFCVVRGAEIRGINKITDPALSKAVAAVANDLVLLTARRTGHNIVPLTPAA